MEELFVIGTGVCSALGRGVGVLVDGLLDARCAIQPWSAFADAKVRFPVAAAVDDAWLDRVGDVGDRGTDLLATAIGDAWRDAFGRDMDRDQVSRQRVGLVVGTSSIGIESFCRAIATGSPAPTDSARYASATEAIAMRLGVTGPVMTVGCVCASGAVAIVEAAELVIDGEVDIAIAAGVDPLEPFVGTGFDALGALSGASLPFCAGRRGLVLGEGAGALVMCRSKALGRGVRGVLAGWGISSDAHHLTAPDPQGRGVVRAVQSALRRSGLSADRIGVINAHGTATQFNDAMEAAAYTTLFGPRAGGRPVHTVKSMIGHTLGAAGAIEAAVALEAMRRKLVPPTLATANLDPACDLDVVIGKARPCDADTTLSVSAGFGGINCALILQADQGAQP